MGDSGVPPAAAAAAVAAAAAATAVAATAAAAAAAAAAVVAAATATTCTATLAEAGRSVPPVFAHRLAALVDEPTAAMVYLAVPGRGDVWRRAPDDEAAPDTPAFEQFFTALPDAVRQCLVDGGAPDAVHPRVLLEGLSQKLEYPGVVKYPGVIKYPTETARDVFSAKGAIDAAGCAALRREVDARRSVHRDSVDKLPEHQLDLRHEELERLVGEPTVARLWRLPAQLAAQCGTSEVGAPAGRREPRYRVELVVRRYSRGTRPLLNFHRDACAFTVNVALADDAAHEGGHLLAVLDDRVQLLSRAEGEATVHPSTVLHAVSGVTSGVRYSLLLFYYEDEEGDPVYT